MDGFNSDDLRSMTERPASSALSAVVSAADDELGAAFDAASETVSATVLTPVVAGRSTFASIHAALAGISRNPVAARLLRIEAVDVGSDLAIAASG